MADDQIPLAVLLAEQSINFSAVAEDRDDAIRQAGEALIASGAVDASYIDAMLERENSVSTFMGEGVAIPHGTLAGAVSVKANSIVLLRFPQGVDWDGNDVRMVFGIAAKGNGHIALLSQLATVLLDPSQAEALRKASTTEQVYAVLQFAVQGEDA